MPDISFPILPINEVIPELIITLKFNDKIVLEAPPGAGKTTLVPLALLKSSILRSQKILVLEPRRLAARAAAYRMSQILNEPIGKTVGFRVRLENKISAATKIEVVTEGILIRKIQEDPALEGIGTIIFDEFHERSLQADLALALALDAQSVLRPDIKFIVMSATLDSEKIGKWLNAPVIRSKGAQFEIKTEYLTPSEVISAGSRPVERLTNLIPKAISKALKNSPEGDILVFLPGMTEIRKVAKVLENKISGEIDLHLLHGDLSLAQQQAAIQPGKTGKPKIILSTSIAETSLTIEGVKVVIDGGYSRIPKFIHRTGLTSLITVPVSKAAADQRRGRAGRLGPGTCYRLWSLAEDQQMPQHLNPEILDADLSSLKLELTIWGNQDVNALKWLDPPPTVALAQAHDVLLRIKAINPYGQPTPHGKAIAALGMQPRLGHLVIRGNELGYGYTACILAALLSERDFLKNNSSGFSPFDDSGITNIQERLELLHSSEALENNYIINKNIKSRIFEHAENLKQKLKISDKTLIPDSAGILLALAYPDRLAKAESLGKVRLTTGQIINLNTEDFGNSEYYSIAHMDSKNMRGLLAAALDKKDLINLFIEDIEESEEIFLDKHSGKVIGRKIKKLGAIILDIDQSTSLTQEKISKIFHNHIKTKGLGILPWDTEAQHLLQRLKFLHYHLPKLWQDYSDEVLYDTLEEWLFPHLTAVKSLEDLSRLKMAEILKSNIPWAKQQELEKLAPTHLLVPSGSIISINYAEPDTPILAVRLQEIFGLTETPVIAGGKVKLLLHLLSPAFRPVQVTTDLNSFWKKGYFEVRKDLKGRYPKHAWPEDPLTAPAIRGAKKRKY